MIFFKLMAYNVCNQPFRASLFQPGPAAFVFSSSHVVRMAFKSCSPSGSGRSVTSLIWSLLHSPSSHSTPSVLDRLEAGTSASPIKVIESEKASLRDEVPLDGRCLPFEKNSDRATTSL